MPGYDSWKTRSPDDDIEGPEEPMQEQQRADYEDEMQQQDDSAKRARIAYDAFRSGFEHDGTVPHWDDARPWVRDVVLVAYLQGKLDAHGKREPHYKTEYGPDGMVRCYQDGWVVR